MSVNEWPADAAPVDGRAHTIGLVGAKGGVGTTVLTSSLAWALAQRGLHVLVLDLDRRGGQAALHLCEHNAGPTVREALQVIERLDATLLDTLLTPCGPHLRLLPAPRQWIDSAFEPDWRAEHLQHLFQTAGALADCVLLDLPPQALQEAAGSRLLESVDEAVLIGEPTLPATFNARRAWSRLRELREEAAGEPCGRTRFVLNKAHGPHGLSAQQVRRTLGLEADARAWREMPRSDSLVAQATYEGQALGALDPRHALSRALALWASECASGIPQRHREAATGPTAWAAPLTPVSAPVHKPFVGTWRERLQRWAT